MRQAREILRDYRERRHPGASAGSSDAMREENLRRLLRHVGAAHQPSEPFEAGLLQAMLRTQEEMAARRGPGSRGAGAWSRLSRPAWQLWAPAAALAVSALVFATQIPRSHHPTEMGSLPPTPQPAPRPVRVSKPAPLIGYVLMGELLRQHPGEQRWQPVGSGAAIHLDDTVSTDENRAGSVVFLDSSLCRVLPNSTLQYTAAVRTGLQRPSRLLLARGETWNTVEKGGPPFMVQTRAATAVVWGTEFGVAVDAKGKTTLRVREGKVELQAARASVLVPAGMQSVVLPGHAPQPRVSMTPAPRPPHPVKPQPGTLHLAPPAGGSAGGAGTDESGKTFRRSPAPAAQPPASTGTPPHPMPTDSSGAPTSSSGDHEAEPRMPVSTSR